VVLSRSLAGFDLDLYMHMCTAVKTNFGENDETRAELLRLGTFLRSDTRDLEGGYGLDTY
jgi:hypothetical protein